MNTPHPTAVLDGGAASRELRRALGATLAAALLCLAPASQAGPFVEGPIIFPTLGDGPPDGPDPHPGKEYTDELDKNADEPPEADPGRVIRWDGAGGRTDSTKFTPVSTPGVEIDAMANHADLLFSQLLADVAPMAFSLRDADGRDIDAPVWYETTAAGGGVRAPWATAAQVDQAGVTNLDALEIWGPDESDDANKFSLLGDAGHNVSIFNLDGSTYLGFPDFSAVMAPLLEIEEPDILDIDALMVSGADITGEFDDGDSILFSLWPALDPTTGVEIVGDEVWLWEFGSTPVFLNHGGHLWSSGWLGENVDAIEGLSARPGTVPEPTSLALFGLGLAWLGFGKRRRAA